MKEYNIASIPGDGIGKEVLPEGLKVLKDAALKHQFKINFTEYDFASCDYYEKHGKMLPDDWKEKLGKHDAIFFGAVGDKKIADDITLWGLRLNICQGLDQFANVRPSKYIEGINSPLKKEIAKKIDWIIVREPSSPQTEVVSAITRLGINNKSRSSFFIRPVYPQTIKWANVG